MWVGNFSIKNGGIDVPQNLNTTIDTMEGTKDDPPPSCGNIADDNNSNPPPSCGNTGDCTSESCEDVTAESNHVAASCQSMTYANTVKYDKSKNPKDINWISDGIKAKSPLYKPDNLSLSNTTIDPDAAEAAFLEILEITINPLFGSTNIKWSKQEGRLLTGTALL